MEREIPQLIFEEMIVSSVTDYGIPEDDPEGYCFYKGCEFGLERAVKIMEGEEPLDEEQIDELYAQRMMRERDVLRRP